MKTLQVHVIAASLAMAAGAMSHAEDGDRYSASVGSPQATRTAVVAEDYFDANWAVTSGSEAPRPTAGDSMQSVASDYFDANWRAVAGSRSNPASFETE